jgi:predicted small lipoprotein YifL
MREFAASPLLDMSARKGAILLRRKLLSVGSIALLLAACGQKGPLLLPDAYAHRHDAAAAGSGNAAPAAAAPALPTTPGGPATSDASMSQGSPLGPATGPILPAPDPSTTRGTAASTVTHPAPAPSATPSAAAMAAPLPPAPATSAAPAPSSAAAAPSTSAP